jgi:hypothetical protein
MAGRVLCVDVLERPCRVVESADPGAGWRGAGDRCESSQRAAIRVADAVQSFAPAPLREDMAIVVAQVTPGAASEVAS